MTPFHRSQIKHVNILRELIDILFIATEDIHKMIDDTGRMTVSSSGNLAQDFRSGPALRVRVETEKNIACWIVVTTPPNINLEINN